MQFLLTLAFALAGIAPAICALYLLVLALAALFHRERSAPYQPKTGLAVLVPAHNEARLIGRCIDSLLGQRYPSEKRRVIVIADNCSDDTAAVARAAGAEVWERVDPALPGKGRALRWAMDRLISQAGSPEAVVVVDADSVADPMLLLELSRAYESGHDVVQGDYQALDDSMRRPSLSAIAFLLFHRVRFTGRMVLGMPANLVGNGMLFSRRILAQHPWDAFSAVEDLEYSMTLRLRGVRPAFAPTALVFGPIGGEKRTATAQRRRWEGGRFFVVRRYLPRLLGHAALRDPSVLDAALDLATPPLGLLALIAIGGAALSTGASLAHAVSPAALLTWLAALIVLPLYVLVGLRSAHAPAASYVALVHAPVFVLRKALLYPGMLRRHDPTRWDTPDDPPATSTGSRVSVAGVPLDTVNMEQALDRLSALMGGGTLSQVCTVNVDFMVSAQRNAEIRRIFQRTALNIADGLPVVWLGRLLGHRVPMRVAGADLVPELVRIAAGKKAGVFLLGGEGGVAAAAAATLLKDNPGIAIDWMEPPHLPIERMPNEEIVSRINASGADVLLVALGHPKQDRWIDQHRDQLRVSIAVGVGCCLDLIAGRVERAPRWMQAAGLEWFFRLTREPQRLAGRYVRDALWLCLLVLKAGWQRLSGRVEEVPVTATLTIS